MVASWVVFWSFLSQTSFVQLKLLIRSRFLIEITWLAYDFTPSSFVYAVPISTIATFHKMKKLTRDHALIVSALKESSFLVSFFIADLVVTCSMNVNRWIN